MINVPRCASTFILYALIKIKAKHYIITCSDLYIQSFLHFYYKREQILRNVTNVSAYVLRTLLLSRRKRTFQDKGSKVQNSLDPEREPIAW